MSIESRSRKSSRTSNTKRPQWFSKKDQLVIMRYLYQQECMSSEVHKLMAAACGREAPTYSDVRTFMKDLEEGRDEPDFCICDGVIGKGKKKSLPTDGATDPALVARIEVLLTADIRITMERLADMSMVSSQTVQSIIINLMRLKRVCEKWVPRFWTPEQRAYRMAVCQELLDIYHTEGPSLFSRIVVGDAAFAMYHAYSPESRANCVITNGPGSKFKPPEEPERVYCALYYDARGMLLMDDLDCTTMTSEEYIKVIRDRLLPAIRWKRGERTEPLYLIQTVTPAYQSIETLQALRDFNIIPLSNASASPDLEPHEYWLFKILKGALDELNFQSRTDLMSAIQRQIHSLTDADFRASIERLADRWNICIEKQGLYLL